MNNYISAMWFTGSKTQMRNECAKKYLKCGCATIKPCKSKASQKHTQTE